MIQVRLEREDDRAAIRSIYRAAFPTAVEADLVDRMRAAGRARVSLVAEREGTVVGHIVFSPVVIHTHDAAIPGLGLAPVAVAPDHQRQGIGSALIREGLDACRREDCPYVVVLGDPAYYPRFGFQRASDLGLTNEYGVDEPFMVIELRDGSLPPTGGQVRYGPDFDGFAES